MKLKRENIVPGVTVQLKSGHELSLNPHLIMFPGMGFTLLGSGTVKVLSLPRKIDGINLVRVEVGGKEYEVYYCDILNHCEKE